MQKLKGVFTDEQGTKYKGELTVEESVRWRAERGGMYRFLVDYGPVFSSRDTYTETDNFRHLTRNYFRTKEEAQAHLDRTLAEARLRDAVDEYNGEWKADWDEKEQSKYEIVFDHLWNKFIFEVRSSFKSFNAFYLKDDNQAFLKEHEADLRLVWGLVDKK
jgi:hypothetical protein